ncbi:hypothetical protein D3C85_798260 [compost metagenome]|jgi:uncharacterized lipoprotein YajG
MNKTLASLIIVSAVATLSGCAAPSSATGSPSVSFRSVDVAGERVSLADTHYIKDGKAVSCQQYIENVNTVPSPQGTETTVHTYNECQAK